MSARLCRSPQRDGDRSRRIHRRRQALPSYGGPSVTAKSPNLSHDPRELPNGWRLRIVSGKEEGSTTRRLSSPSWTPLTDSLQDPQQGGSCELIRLRKLYGHFFLTRGIVGVDVTTRYPVHDALRQQPFLVKIQPQIVVVGYDKHRQ